MNLSSLNILRRVNFVSFKSVLAIYILFGMTGIIGCALADRWSYDLSHPLPSPEATLARAQEAVRQNPNQYAICPVCGGTGQYKPSWSANRIYECSSCGGKGYVEK